MGVEKTLLGCREWECELLLTAKKLYGVPPKEQQQRASENLGRAISAEMRVNRLDVFLNRLRFPSQVLEGDFSTLRLSHASRDLAPAR